MARMFPRELPSTAEKSEKEVFRALEVLGDDWIVIHDVRFVVPRAGKRDPRNGQADFVLLHQRRGFIVLEAKGGGYEVEDGRWYTFPGNVRTLMEKSPFDQARGNRYDLANYLGTSFGVRAVPAGHAVAFTDGSPRGNLGPEAPADIIVHGTDLDHMNDVISRIVTHWFGPAPQELSDEDFDRVLAALLPNASVQIDERYKVDSALHQVRSRTERQILLTQEQLAVLDATTGSSYLAVMGAAGTGKTLIAIKLASDRASRGERVVLIADQRYLHGELRNKPLLKHGNITLGTPEEVVAQLDPKREPGADLVSEIIGLVDAGVVVDTLIVDEAQSFDEDLLNALRLLSGDRAIMFADPYQRDASGMWRPPDNPPNCWLTQNCRNSLPIAKLVARLSGSISPSTGASGPVVQFITQETDSEQAQKQVIAIASEMLTTVSPNELAILSCLEDVTSLSLGLRQAGMRVARKPSDDGVRVLPAAEYRGCESTAVLFVAGTVPQCQPVERGRTNHYVATSRAIAYLTIVGESKDWSDYMFLMEN